MCMFRMKNANKQPKLTKEQKAHREQETIKMLTEAVSKTDIGRSVSQLIGYTKKHTTFDI